MSQPLLKQHFCTESSNKFLCSLVNSIHLWRCQHQRFPHIICRMYVLVEFPLFFSRSCRIFWGINGLRLLRIQRRWTYLLASSCCSSFLGWLRMHPNQGNCSRLDKQPVNIHSRRSFMDVVGAKSLCLWWLVLESLALDFGLNAKGRPAKTLFAGFLQPILGFLDGFGWMKLV